MKKPRAKPKPNVPATLDQISECCQRIETLAGLLKMCDGLDEAYAVNRHLIGSAGFMIAEETASLRQWLGKLPRA